jgi:hypothetical protein
MKSKILAIDQIRSLVEFLDQWIKKAFLKAKSKKDWSENIFLILIVIQATALDSQMLGEDLFE